MMVSVSSVSIIRSCWRWAFASRQRRVAWGVRSSIGNKSRRTSAGHDVDRRGLPERFADEFTVRMAEADGARKSLKILSGMG